MFLGAVADRVKTPTVFVFLGICYISSAHILLLLLPDCDRCWVSVVPFVLLGLGYCTNSVILYPLVSLLVPPQILGTAYGFQSVVQNFATITVPPLIGAIKDNTEKMHGYFWTELFFIFFSVFPIVPLFYLRKLLKQTKEEQ